MLSVSWAYAALCTHMCGSTPPVVAVASACINLGVLRSWGPCSSPGAVCLEVLQRILCGVAVHAPCLQLHVMNRGAVVMYTRYTRYVPRLITLRHHQFAAQSPLLGRFPSADASCRQEHVPSPWERACSMSLMLVLHDTDSLMHA